MVAAAVLVLELQDEAVERRGLAGSAPSAKSYNGGPCICDPSVESTSSCWSTGLKQDGEAYLDLDELLWLVHDTDRMVTARGADTDNREDSGDAGLASLFDISLSDSLLF